MTEKEFDFWRDHSLNYLDMVQRRDKIESIANPDGYGKDSSDCGDTIEFFLMSDGESIESISIKINGCVNTLAAANTLAHMNEGKSMEQAWEITPEEIVEYLETMPESSEHCAEIAVSAWRSALIDFQRNKQNPWKKLYGVR